MTTTTVDGRYTLGSHTDETLGTSCTARLFGTLVEVALPIIEYYHSDLYHDADWLRKYVATSELDSFYFGVDSHGTAIGTDLTYVQMCRTNVWHIGIITEGRLGTRTAILTKVS